MRAFWPKASATIRSTSVTAAKSALKRFITATATPEARVAYRRAMALVHDDAERRLLERRLAELGTLPATPGTDRGAPV